MNVKRFYYLLLASGILLAGCNGHNHKIPTWDECRYASCWRNNAADRMMNSLSPHMPDSVFLSYLDWQKVERKCDTVHLILANRLDGKYGGYCIYGNEWSWNVYQPWVDVMLERIKLYRENDLAVVLWLLTDDSAPYARELKKDPARYLNDLKNLGLLESASTVVLGLEMGEGGSWPGWSNSDYGKLSAAARAVYSGKLGTHQNSYYIDLHGFGDIIFYQMEPGHTPAYVKSKVKQVRAATGKPVNAFELSRNPAPELCEAAMGEDGAFGCGNR